MQSDRIDSLAVNFWRTTLKIFNAADFGIVPNEDISEKLAEFISVLKAEDGEKTAVFDSGTYYIDGKVTNIAIEDCRNITLRNLEIRHAHPDMHEFLVVRKSAFSVDFKIDSDSSFSVYALLC